MVAQIIDQRGTRRRRGMSSSGGGCGAVLGPGAPGRTRPLLRRLGHRRALRLGAGCQPHVEHRMQERIEPGLSANIQPVKIRFSLPSSMHLVDLHEGGGTCGGSVGRARSRRAA